MQFGSRKEGVQANCGGKFQTYEVLNKRASDGGRGTRAEESCFDPKQEERTGVQAERPWSSQKSEAEK